MTWKFMDKNCLRRCVFSHNLTYRAEIDGLPDLISSFLSFLSFLVSLSFPSWLVAVWSNCSRMALANWDSPNNLLRIMWNKRLRPRGSLLIVKAFKNSAFSCDQITKTLSDWNKEMYVWNFKIERLAIIKTQVKSQVSSPGERTYSILGMHQHRDKIRALIKANN